MAQEEKTIEQQENVKNVDTTYHRILKYYTNHQNIVYSILLGILIIGALIFAFFKFYQQPRALKAMDLMAQSQIYFEQDSLLVALEGDDNSDGFLKIADQYSGTPAGNLAKYYAAVCYINLKDNDEALKYLKKYRKNNPTFGASAYMLMGDIYLEEGNTKQAMKHYDKAIKEKSVVYSPVAMAKKAMVYEIQDNWKEAYNLYSEIEKKYYETYSNMNIEAYQERAKQKAEK